MSLARAGARTVYRGRLETIVLVVLVFLIVVQHGFLSLSRYNIGYHIYEQIRDENGDLSIGVSLKDGEAAAAIASEVLRAERVELKTFYRVKATIGNNTFIAPLISLDELPGFASIASLKEGRPPEAPGEAGVYTVVASGSRGLGLEGSVKPGDRLVIEAYTGRGIKRLEVNVTGVYKGFSWVAGSPYSILVPSVPEELRSSGFAIVSIWLASGDPEDAASMLVEALNISGVKVYDVFVNSPERNPIAALVKSGFNLLSIPASIMLAFAFILPAAAGSVSVFRDMRTLSVLRAMGAGRGGLALYYMVPWILRAVIGVIIAVVFLAVYSDNLYFKLFVGDSEIAREMAESYGFKLDPATLARASVNALAMVVLGSLVPLIAASRVDIVQVLRIGELPIVARPPRIGVPGPLLLRNSLRDLAARWWKVLGFILSMGLLWGVSVAIDMETGSLNEIKHFFLNESRTDLYMTFASVAPEVPEPVSERVARLLDSDDRVYSFTVFDGESAPSLLPNGARVMMFYIVITGGDPATAFPLEDGRYPSGPGEAAISVYMADYLGVGLGDGIELEAPNGSTVSFTIVGLTKSMTNNGFHAIVAPGEDLFQTSPGTLFALAYVDLRDGVDPKMFADSFSSEVSKAGYIVQLRYFTRYDLAKSFDTLINMIKVFYGGIAVLTAIAGGIALAGIALVDSSARSREYAALLALGGRGSSIISGYIVQVLLSLLLSAPLALAIGYVTARETARGTAGVLGYIPPSPSPGALVNGLLLVVAGIALFFIAVSLAIRLRRMNIVGILRE